MNHERFRTSMITALMVGFVAAGRRRRPRRS